MSVVVVLMMASLGVALLFLAAFWWSVRTGQFDDTETPALRLLSDEDVVDPDQKKETKP